MNNSQIAHEFTNEMRRAFQRQIRKKVALLVPAIEQTVMDAIVGIDEKFLVDGDQLEAPGDPKGKPENVIRCRCTLGFLTQEEE